MSKEESEIVRLLNDHDKTISFDGQSLEMCVGDVIELYVISVQSDYLQQALILFNQR